MEWGIPPFRLQDVRNSSSRKLAVNHNIKRYSIEFDEDIDFGDIPINTPRYLWVTMRNNGAYPLDVQRIAIGQPFSLQGDSKGFLRPGDEMKIKVICNMTRTGPLTYILLVYTDKKQFSIDVKVNAIPKIGSFPKNRFPQLHFNN